MWNVDPSCTVGGRGCTLEITSISCGSINVDSQVKSKTNSKKSETAEGNQPQKAKLDNSFCSALPRRINDCKIACNPAASNNGKYEAACKKWMTFFNDYEQGLVGSDGQYKTKPRSG